MTMKRIKIRSDDATNEGKILRFEESIDLESLILKIAHKLGVVIDSNYTVDDQLELRLQGNLLEHTNEIDAEDDIVLVQKSTVVNAHTQQSNMGTAASVGEPRTVAEESTEEKTRHDANSRSWNDCWAYDPNAVQGKRKRTKRDPFNVTNATVGNETRRPSGTANDDGNRGNRKGTTNDSDVEDTTEQEKQNRATEEAKQEVLELSSDEDADNSDDDESDDDGSIEEGSDAWDPSSDEEDEDFDVEYIKEIRKKPATNIKKNPKPPPEAPLKVIMEAKDLPSAPGLPAEVDDTPSGLDEVSTLIDVAGRKKADGAVKDRIIKLLNTGFHDQSNENEAKNAMKLAQRLMKKHNLSQAILLKERQDKNEKEQNGGAANDEILKGGIVKVCIVNRKTNKPAIFARWIANLTDPIGKNFDVKSYHIVSRGRKCIVAFYGIYTNCQLAAYAFRVATERISQMTAVYKPEKSDFDMFMTSIRNGSAAASTKSSRLSYALGIVKGIDQDVERNIRLEKERQEQKLAKARMAVKTGEAYQESDDEDGTGELGDGLDNNEGFGFSHSSGAASDEDKKPAAKVSTVAGEANESDSDDDDIPLVQLGKPKAKSKAELEADRRLKELENLQQAAIVLVDHREKIAEQVLENNGIKLRQGRQRKAITFDRKSYHRGVEDAKEIDINQRAIRDEVKIKKEEKK